MLVILCGPPCTGKSAIGTDLQNQFGFIHLEVDSIRQRILPNSDQNIEDRDTAYRAMHLMTEHLLREGASVVVDATYNRELHRKELAAVVKALETSAALIQCKAPLDVVLARFGSRPPGHVLTAIGKPPDENHGSLRFSLSSLTTEDDVNYVLEMMPSIVERLRELSPHYKR